MLSGYEWVFKKNLLKKIKRHSFSVAQLTRDSAKPKSEQKTALPESVSRTTQNLHDDSLLFFVGNVHTVHSLRSLSIGN